MPTILVVDDTAVDRRLAGGLLENAPNMEVCYAENGKQALAQIGASLPDLVVTDLQMPELDGLELVTAIADRYPDLPVVLMTAHGSEVVAAQALANGAASFVPKSELSDNLLQTVMHILVMSETDSRYKKLIRCTTKSDFEFDLDNDPSLIDPLIDMVQQVAFGQSSMTHNERVQIGVALEHALLNAMIRGNLELSRADMPVLNRAMVQERQSASPFDQRRVYFRSLVTAEKTQFTIRDNGPGFDTSKIPAATDPDSFRDGTGRGLVLIQSAMDEVTFDESGNELVMTKYGSKSPTLPR
ncbi:MAG: CheY-like chemotaxis protein [Mariniblastus sp.]|jgi:CheY-like chemotaxis protein